MVKYKINIYTQAKKQGVSLFGTRTLSPTLEATRTRAVGDRKGISDRKYWQKFGKTILLFLVFLYIWRKNIHVFWKKEGILAEMAIFL